MKNNKDKPIFLGNIYGYGRGFGYEVFNIKGVAPTLTTMQGGGRQPHIVVKNKNG